MVTYTKIAKPTSSIYTIINPIGREQYDQPTLEYDDSGVFYDGVNQGAYTKVAKPITSVYTKIAKPV